MTETKKKVPKKKGQGDDFDNRPAWMIGNPLYNGLDGYTLGQYLKESRGYAPKSPQFSVMERLFNAVVTPENFPQEYEHMTRIKEAVRSSFKGSTYWEHYDYIGNYYPSKGEGDYWDHWDYSLMTYYELYYNRPDEWTIKEYLDKLTKKSEIKDQAEAYIPEVSKLIHEKHPDIVDVAKAQIETYSREFGNISLSTNAAVWKELLGPVTLEREIIGLSLSYSEYVASKVEEPLPLKDYIEAYIDNMREESSIESEIYFYLDSKRPDLVPPGYEDIVEEYEQSLKDAAGGILDTYNPHPEGQGGIKNQRIGPTTLEVAKGYPIAPRNNLIVPHGGLSNEISHVRPDPHKIIINPPRTDQLRLDGNFNHILFNIPHNNKTGLKVMGDIQTPKGVIITPRHQEIMSTIASVIIEKNPKVYTDGNVPIKEDQILETELIARAYGIKKENVTEEYKLSFRNDMLELKSALYIPKNWGELKKHNKLFRAAVERQFPNYGDNPRISLVDFDMADTMDGKDSTSYRYVIRRFPILDFMDIYNGMASRLRYSLLEAPAMPWDSIPEKIQRFIETLEDHKNPSICLYKTKDGARYLPALQTREKSVYMYVILRELETNNNLSMIENKRYFPMDLNRIMDDVWREDKAAPNKMKVQRRTALLSYLVRLWINKETNPSSSKEEAQIYGLTVLTKGRSWPKVRVYLREPTETMGDIPAISELTKSDA